MIRIIIYLTFYILGISITNAQIKSEEITVYNKEIQLSGTLTFSNEKSPLIIWVHGSGPIDRNGNQPAQNVNANYIKQFRDAVNKQSIALFSFDKRTANKNNSNFLKDTKFTDFASDIEVIVNHFKKNKHFSKIVLIGHSQGSLVAMLASKNVDKYVSIAGTAETINKTIVKQIGKNNPTLAEAAQKHFDTLIAKGKIKTVNPFLTSIFAKQNQSFLLSWLQVDPIEEIKKITIPTLIINGNKDLQVTVLDAENLKKSKPNAKLVVINNMNHVLKNIQKDEDNLASYFSSDFPISEKLITTIVEFVKK